jgi:D-amino-acid oxidase
MYAHSVPDPDWASVVPSYRHLSTADLAALDPTQSYTHGFAYDTIIAEGMLYMRYLLQLIEETGRITIERRRLDSLAALSSYDVIINAAGLGARELAPDPAMYAIRGHVLRVKAPWVRYHVEAGQRDDASPAYIIPNNNGIVVLGGTKEKGDEDTVARESDREAILKRCSEVVPSLAAAEVVASWVGLRPGRAGVRLEVEQRAEGPSIVHNYGHGGSGLTLGWGCALEAADMAAAELER